MKNRVVITGMGVVSPNGVGINDFNEAIKIGKSGIIFLQELKDLGLNCHVGGIPVITEKTKSILPKELCNKLEASNLIYGVIASIEAWVNAKLTVNDEVDWESGTVMGMQVSDGHFMKSLITKIYGNNIRKLTSRTAEQMITSSLASYISGYFGFGNCSISNSSACATGTEAILIGYDRIKNGGATRILAGSTEGNGTLLLAALDHIRVLNHSSNDRPEDACNPMSVKSAGLVPGCGAGALVLESLVAAQKRNAMIYAEIVGGATNCGGQRTGGSMTKPNPEGMSRCIKQAMENAKIAPNQIDLISGHLTATFADSLEVEVWSNCLKRRRDEFPYINSLKSMTGHCFAAAGTIESIATVLQLHNEYIHPSINCQEIHPKILEYLVPERIPSILINKKSEYVAKASFGFGDLNSCLIFKKW
jgi:3-oxoacyl-(acyl-carrier-protein) synthase